MNFDMAFDRLMGHEGGYVNNPKDPGGETKWGISRRSYPNLDIRNLTREEAKAIYYRDFWNIIKSDDVSEAVMFQVFDIAVNSGIQTAIRMLQRAVGAADDGHWGPISQGRLQAYSDSDIIMLINAERLEFITKLSTWSTFGKGWTKRIAQNLKYGAGDS